MSTEPVRDIETSEDVELLVRAFYQKVYQDELLAPIFTEVAGVQMDDRRRVAVDEHLQTSVPASMGPAITSPIA